jgi:phytoene dehydrogenase-like protein
MKNKYDVVVVGAGHNSLVTAAYLAVEGLSVAVFEKNDWIGGGVVTRELTVPGFKHDSHSTGHIFIQGNPLIAKDELKLQEKYGLEYITPACYFTSLFPDGKVLQTFGSLEKTCQSIAKYSEKDADSYRRFVRKSEQLLPLFEHGLFNPPAGFGSFMSFLDQSPNGKDLIGDLNKSAWDIVNDLFENDRVKMHFMRWSSECMMGPETKGTGAVLFLMCTFTHKHNAKFPKGGSGVLSDSLVRCIEDHGGEVYTNAAVKKLEVKGGKAKHIVLENGEIIEANRAVVASIHPHLLEDFVDGQIDERLAYLAKRVSLSDYAAINTHYALNEAPKYIADEDIDQSFAVETQPETMDEFRGIFDAYRYGKIPEHLSLLSICTSNADPSRAPKDKSTLYLYTFVPGLVENGSLSDWQRHGEVVADKMLNGLRKVTSNMSDDNILGRAYETPYDFQMHNPSFRNGDIIGAALVIDQYMGRRPFSEMANYAVPGIESLYLVGPFMHPGGGVIGGGRPAAIKILNDLNIKSSVIS